MTSQPAIVVPGSPGPVAGSYEYEVVVDELDGSRRVQEQTQTFSRARKVGTGWRQRATTVAGFVVRIDQHAWSDSGLRLLSRDHPSQIRSDEGTTFEHDPCIYEPPDLLYQFPLRVGSEWRTRGMCTYEDGRESDYAVRRVVVGVRSVDVAGAMFECFLVEEWSGGTRDVTRCFSPTLGVVLRASSPGQFQGDEAATTVLKGFPAGHPAAA